MDKLSKLLKDYAARLATRGEVFQELISGQLVVIAAYQSLQDNVFNIQDYILNGQSYIPIFSDAATAHRLLQGVKFAPGMQLSEIQADFLFAAFQGNEWLIVNANDEFFFEMYAHEIKPYLSPLEIPTVIKPSEGLGGRRHVLAEPTSVKISQPSHPPPAEVLEEMQSALLSTEARTVYWFWMSVSGGQGHLGIAVDPADEAIMDQVGTAIESIWMQHRPNNSLIDIMPLDTEGLSEALRTQGQLLYKAQSK